MLIYDMLQFNFTSGLIWYFSVSNVHYSRAPVSPIPQKIWEPTKGATQPASRLTRLGRVLQAKMQEPQPRAGEKNGARKSEPARELSIFEFPVFDDEHSDLIGCSRLRIPYPCLQYPTQMSETAHRLIFSSLNHLGLFMVWCFSIFVN